MARLTCGDTVEADWPGSSGRVYSQPHRYRTTYSFISGPLPPRRQRRLSVTLLALVVGVGDERGHRHGYPTAGDDGQLGGLRVQLPSPALVVLETVDQVIHVDLGAVLQEQPADPFQDHCLRGEPVVLPGPGDGQEGHLKQARLQRATLGLLGQFIQDVELLDGVDV